MVQYEEVANAIRKAVERIFQEKNYPKKRSLIWSFILRIHWNEVRKESNISIAGFSPSGLASTSMLELRLKRYFPFIQQIHFYRIADLKNRFTRRI